MKNRTWTRNKHADGQILAGRLIQLLTFGLFAVALTNAAYAGPREQAKRIHDRLAGVPPSETVLGNMEADILSGQPLQAAITAMEDPNSCSMNVGSSIRRRALSTRCSDQTELS